MRPPGLYKGKKIKENPGQKIDWIVWAPAAAAAAGIAAAMILSLLHQREWAMGIGWGSLLNFFNFYGLKILTEKVLTRGEVEGRKYFWSWNLVRWIFLVFGCWWFLSISPLCLAAAGVSYFCFLVVLGLAGWRSASSPFEK